MTNAQLQKALRDFPDDMPVTIHSGSGHLHVHFAVAKIVDTAGKTSVSLVVSR